jgi:hypothetical protein
MPGIVPMIEPAAATRVGETAIVLPDPERTLTDPIFRPGIAWHPGATVILLEVRALPAQTLVVRAPATSAVRGIDIPPLGPVTRLLELSPLPFGDATRAVFAELRAVPTFYVGLPFTSLPDDDLVEIGADLGTVGAATSAWIGAVFPDGVTRIPSAWIELIAARPATPPRAGPGRCRRGCSTSSRSSPTIRWTASRRSSPGRPGRSSTSALSSETTRSPCNRSSSWRGPSRTP